MSDRKPADVVREDFIFPLIRQMEALGVITITNSEPPVYLGQGEGQLKFADGRIVTMREGNLRDVLELLVQRRSCTTDDIADAIFDGESKHVSTYVRRLKEWNGRLLDRWIMTPKDSPNGNYSTTIANGTPD